MKPPNFAPAYAGMLPLLVDVAREKGYALAVHGSLSRDLDVIAVPWIDAACGPEELAGALADSMKWIGPQCPPRGPVKKPHGRLGYVIALDGGAYIDLSIMPMRSDPPPEPTVPGPETTP